MIKYATYRVFVNKNTGEKKKVYLDEEELEKLAYYPDEWVEIDDEDEDYDNETY